VELMGGALEAQSAPSRGSEFSFTLPLPAATVATVETPPAWQDWKVLVVDDHATGRAALVDDLQAVGVRPAAVADAAAALQELRLAALADQPYQLALLDLDLPGMDGQTLARTLRADRDLAGLRLILLTGGRWLEPVPEVEVILPKPVRNRELHDALARLAGAGSPVIEPPPVRRNSAGFAGRRILLVEDNPVNQVVGREMLQQAGLAVDIAGDGREALQALDKRAYDLVLMDCQMPEMDGYEATRLIRAREPAGTGVRLPIVALTAYAMPGDREKCLAAGMDDYLSKPFSRQALHAMLQRNQTA